MTKKGNEVFSEEKEKMTVHDVMKQSAQKRFEEEFGFEIPVEVVPLPSKGLVYPEHHPLHAADTVEISSMTAREEDILTSRALIKKGTVITQLIRSCLTNKNINVDSLLSGDKNALMIAIRITGYGSDYNVEIGCPSCDEKFKNMFNLNEMPIRSFSIEPTERGSNLFSFTLPKTGKEVLFKFLTGSDEEELMKMADRKKKSFGEGAIDSTVTTRLIASVYSFAGITDKGKLAQILRNLPAYDSLALRNHIDENEPGIQMRQYVICPHCGEESEVNIPLGIEFFWPRSSRN